ncbi:MAG: tail fiber domain-containing protein [candidate division Zixibacteria bacterium]|nr:tail fiber domain-containing protein [candidate division Zixibacteria bacterium]
MKMGVSGNVPIRTFVTLISVGIAPGDTSEIELSTDENSASLVVSNIGSSGDISKFSVVADNAGVKLDLSASDPVEGVDASIQSNPFTKKSAFKADNIGSGGFDGSSLELGITGGSGGDTVTAGRLVFSNIGSSGEDGFSLDLGSTRKRSPGGTLDLNGGLIVSNIGSSGLDGVSIELVTSTTGGGGVPISRDGHLTISNLGSSGQDGVSIRVDESGPSMAMLDSLGDTTILLAQGVIRVIPPNPGAVKKFTFAIKADRIELARIAGGSNEVELGVSEDGFLRMIDSLGDTTVQLSGRGTVAFKRAAGGGVPANRVEIADLDADGVLDLRVDGNVTVGTATAVEKLTVTGNICATGTIGACSDARYKRDIATLDNPLGIISKLRGVDFNWRTDKFPEKQFSEMPQVGFVAQEIKGILPGVVSLGADGYYSVDYGRLTPVLVEALKEQQTLIETLPARLNALESRLEYRTTQAAVGSAARQQMIDQLLQIRNL